MIIKVCGLGTCVLQDWEIEKTHQFNLHPVADLTEIST